VRRREFITLLGGAAAAWPLAASAQQPAERTRRIGMLVSNVESDPAVHGRIAAFRQSLEQLGWLEGRNVQIELRFTGDNYERLTSSSRSRRDTVCLPYMLFGTSSPRAA